MKKVKLKEILDGQTFFLSAKTKVLYELATTGITKKKVKGTLITAVVSKRSYVKKPGTFVYVTE